MFRSQPAPAPDPSVLATESLRREIGLLQELIDSKLASADERYSQRYAAQTSALDAAFSAQQTATKAALDAAKEAVNAALTAADKAVQKAESLAERRFEESVRQSDRIMPRSETESRLQELERQLNRRFDAEAKSLNATLMSSQKAVDTAAIVDEKRFSVVERNAAKIGALSDKVESTGARVEGLNALMESKFETYRALVESQADKVALALAASDKAVTKAETATEKRFDAVNEFREQLNDQSKSFVARNEFEAQRSGLVEKVDSLADVLSKSIPRLEAETRWTLMAKQIDDLRLFTAGLTGKTQGSNALFGYIVGGVGLLAAVIAILTRIK